MSENAPQPSFLRWRQLVDKALISHFAISIEDAGISETDLEKSWQSGQTADQYVACYSDKYDLTHLRDWRAIFIP